MKPHCGTQEGSGGGQGMRWPVGRNESQGDSEREREIVKKRKKNDSGIFMMKKMKTIKLK